jgi:hypothetical protein
MMRSNCGFRCGRFAVMALVGILAGGLVVMLLWNWLTPALFGWKQIGFAQALGVLILSKILFGSFHGHRGHDHWRSRMAARLQQMTPEERERFEAGLKAKGCGCGAPGPEAASPGEGTPQP